jgi:hypothetical protein
VRRLLLACLLLAACSKKKEANYKNCLKLRLGMSREQLLALMGPPDSTAPYVEGKSLPHLKGRTAYEWDNVSRFPGPNHVSVEEATGRVLSVRCSEVVISAEVYAEPAVSTAAATAAQVAQLPAALPAESAPDPADAVVEALKTLRPKGAAAGDASRDLDAYFSALPGDAAESRRLKAAPDAAQKALERAVLKDQAGLLGTLWAQDTPEEFRRRSEQLSTGTRLAQERWVKEFETLSVAEKHADAEDAARRLLALGALLVQDWNPAARTAGRGLLAVGLDLVGKSRRFAGKDDKDPVLRAAKNILPHALALGPRAAEGAEIERLAANSQQSLASLPNLLTRPGGRRMYLDAILVAAAVKWSEREARDGRVWPEREALIRLAVEDKDERVSTLGQAAAAMLEGLRKDVAAKDPAATERWRLPERF